MDAQNEYSLIYGCVVRTRHDVDPMWQQLAIAERIGVISYGQMRLRFMVRIRMRQSESVQVAIQNVSAHESVEPFQGVTSLQFFPTFTNGGRY